MGVGGYASGAGMTRAVIAIVATLGLAWGIGHAAYKRGNADAISMYNDAMEASKASASTVAAMSQALNKCVDDRRLGEDVAGAAMVELSRQRDRAHAIAEAAVRELESPRCQVWAQEPACVNL